jgi:hypothetical protein
MVISANPPTRVTVVESSACGLCKFFNMRQVNHILNRPRWNETVTVSLLPVAHLTEIRNANGTVSYAHRFGLDRLRDSFAQICVNNLYSAERALRWAVFSSEVRRPLNELLARFFNEDSGALVTGCINGEGATQFTRNAMNFYRSTRASGTLPFVFLDDQKTPFTWDRNLFFLENVCRLRNDRAELAVCAGLRETEMASIFPTDYDSSPQENDYISYDDNDSSNTSTGELDYEKFWESSDDDDQVPIKNNNSNNAPQKPSRDYLKFFDTEDDDE